MATDTDVYAKAIAAAQAANAAVSARYRVDRPTPSRAWPPLRSCRGDDPAVSVVVAVRSSEGTLIDYQTVTAAELAAARAGPPS
jgi:hypothetical protein